MTKGRTSLILPLIFILNLLTAQTTVVLKPGAIEGKDATLWSNVTTSNSGDNESINAYTWTNSGILTNKRILLEFDLSSIPVSATINEANLSLYFNPTDESESFDEHTGENGIDIQRVIAAWDEGIVNWDNQPSASTMNQVSLPPSTSGDQDYLDINVTDLVKDMHDPAIGNNGFLIKMTDELNVFKSVLFASSDHPQATLHPELEINYTVLDTIDCEAFAPSSLIPNPSFENMSCCPEFEAQLNCADEWIQASAATTDYVHECGILGLPFINAEAPLPFPDGQGAIGFRDGKPDSFNFKEYTGACLMEPLKSGTQYKLDFFIGFQDNVEGSMNLKMAVFASMDCANLPFGNGDPDFGCPTNGPGFVLLGEMEYSGNNEWVNATFEFTPDEDYNVIVLGPSCLINENLEMNPYFFFDNIILAEAGEFGLPIVEITGSPCGEQIVLQSSEKIAGDFQWFKDGEELVGETGTSLTILDPSNPLDPQDGVYQVTVTTDTGCFLGDEYLLEFITTETEIETELCIGDTLIIGNEIITEPEMYNIVLQSEITQCDSVIQLLVTAGDMPEDTISISICAGTVYELNGEEYDAAGEFIQTIERDNACDSLLTLQLSVTDPDTTALTDNFCEGSSIVINGEEFTEAGSYTQSLTGLTGCDSIVTIQLNTLPVDSTTLETSICPGESVLISGVEYNEPGAYEQNFTNTSNCDSTILIIIDRESACVDCELTEDGNFKTNIEITKLLSGKIKMEINNFQSIELDEAELEKYIRKFVHEELSQEKNGLLKSLQQKEKLTPMLMAKHQSPTVYSETGILKTKETMNMVQELKAGRTFSYWISL